MSQSVISDNWSLQNVSELLTNGIDSDIGHVITPNTETDSHGYEEIPSAVIAIEALFDLITLASGQSRLAIAEEISLKRLMAR